MQGPTYLAIIFSLKYMDKRAGINDLVRPCYKQLQTGFGTQSAAVNNVSVSETAYKRLSDGRQ